MKKEFYEQIVAETRHDYEKRKEARANVELQWRLNMDFMNGNQYAEITPYGDVEDGDKQYFWQEREVFNHVAPIVETRASRLNRVKAKVSVRPASSDASDVNAAKLSGKILNATWEEINADDKLRAANMWSEICGSCFYKIGWSAESGKIVGKVGEKSLHEGDVTLTVCPPFEIFPEDLTKQSLEEQRSLIHAKAYPVEQIKEIWGEDVPAEDVDVLTLSATDSLGGLGYRGTVTNVVGEKITDQAVVIEKYVLPTEKDTNGKLITVAGNVLLYYGELPYENGENGKRSYPFVRQCSNEIPGAFFGVSIIERMIPVQRAYNAVKNRKHEFMNRIAMGVLAVEDGSVDTDNLEEEGLSPGKVLIYRQGANPPTMLNAGDVPNDFHYEEEKLLSEFIVISGVSELMNYAKSTSNAQSGVAMSLLIEQDDIRLSMSADGIRFAIKNVGAHILKLYKQFAKNKRLKRICGDNGDVELTYFSSSDITADNLVFDSDNELMDTPSARRNMVYELLKTGILNGEDGKLDKYTRSKALEQLGFGNWEAATDIVDLHRKTACAENLGRDEGQKLEVSEIDDHEIHIAEHTKHLLSTDRNDPEMIAHIKEHKRSLALLSEAENLIKGEQNG